LLLASLCLPLAAQDNPRALQHRLRPALRSHPDRHLPAVRRIKRHQAGSTPSSPTKAPTFENTIVALDIGQLLAR
jgi:hypothetical protein